LIEFAMLHSWHPASGFPPHPASLAQEKSSDHWSEAVAY
jgi:hypothetical protein